jgi:hypothetical protein
MKIHGRPKSGLSSFVVWSAICSVFLLGLMVWLQGFAHESQVSISQSAA